MKSSRILQIFFLLLSLSIILVSACPQNYTDEIYYTNAKERYVVSLKSEQSNLIATHYSYLRDCMDRILIYSTEYEYHDTVNSTKISDNQSVIYIIDILNIYFGWFDPLYVDEKLSKMDVVYSADKDKEVHTNK
jgi:hypothetical protein